MGKKSRRKKVTKKDVKERQLERSTRYNQGVLAHPDVDETVRRSDDPIEVGNRVFYMGADRKTKRAIVKEAQPSRCLVLPVVKEDVPESYIALPKDSVTKDNKEWTLRFQVGDKVLCSSTGHVPATVIDLWPLDVSDDVVPCYRCQRHDLDNELGFKCLAALWDNNTCIMKRPQSFRLSVGEEVTFASAGCNFLSGPSSGGGF